MPLQNLQLLLGDVPEPALGLQVLLDRLQLPGLDAYLELAVVHLHQRERAGLHRQPPNLHRLGRVEVPPGRARLVHVQVGEPLAVPRHLGGLLDLPLQVRDVGERRRRQVGYPVGRHYHEHVLAALGLALPHAAHRRAGGGGEHGCAAAALDARVHVSLVVVAEPDDGLAALRGAAEALEAYVHCASVAAVAGHVDLVCLPLPAEGPVDACLVGGGGSEVGQHPRHLDDASVVDATAVRRVHDYGVRAQRVQEGPDDDAGPAARAAVAARVHAVIALYVHPPRPARKGVLHELHLLRQPLALVSYDLPAHRVEVVYGYVLAA